jgi:hypothetical protein
MSFESTIAEAESAMILANSIDFVEEPEHVDVVVAQLKELGRELPAADRPQFSMQISRAHKLLQRRVTAAQASKLSLEVVDE